MAEINELIMEVNSKRKLKELNLNLNFMDKCLPEKGRRGDTGK